VESHLLGHEKGAFTGADRPMPSRAAWLAIATGLLHCPVVFLLRWDAPAMKTSLDHLPELKRAQLRAITSIFREGAPHGMLILFGSHARGDWVHDAESGYRSDYDVRSVSHKWQCQGLGTGMRKEGKEASLIT